MIYNIYTHINLHDITENDVNQQGYMVNVGQDKSKDTNCYQ